MTTTGGDPVDQPPTTPGTPVVSGITQTGATLTWTAATDDKGVAGYDVLRVQNGTSTVVASSTTTSTALTGLTADTDYVFAVRAKDTAGQLSSASTTVTFRTLPTVTTPPGGCKVTYTANSWGSGFTANVTVTNTGSTAWTSWKLAFTFPGNQKVTQGWSATYSQSGSAVTVTNAAWNGSVPAGGSTSIGFNGSYSGTNSAPTGFTVNGAPCA